MTRLPRIPTPKTNRYLASLPLANLLLTRHFLILIYVPRKCFGTDAISAAIKRESGATPNFGSAISGLFPVYSCGPSGMIPFEMPTCLTSSWLQIANSVKLSVGFRPFCLLILFAYAQTFPTTEWMIFRTRPRKSRSIF